MPTLAALQRSATLFLRHAARWIAAQKITKRQVIKVVLGICLSFYFLIMLYVFIYRDSSAVFYSAPSPDKYEIQSLLETDYSDVTYVTHLTPNRLSALERTMKLWPGPMAVAFFLKNSFEEPPELVSFLARYATRPSFMYSTYSSTEQVAYPVNVLRNQALRLVRTNLAFLADVDFIPSAGMYAHVKANLETLNRLSKDTVFVVPAFEHRAKDTNYPRTKEQVHYWMAVLRMICLLFEFSWLYFVSVVLFRYSL